MSDVLLERVSAFVTPEIAAIRKAEEVGGDEAAREQVRLGYWYGCTAYTELGPDANLGEIIDYALSFTNPDDETATYGYIQHAQDWTPNDLGGTMSLYAYLGAIESRWGDRGEVISDRDALSLGRRQRMLGRTAAGADQMIESKGA